MPAPRRLALDRRLLIVVVIGLLIPFTPEARTQVVDDARQVTLFAIVATPSSARIDPKLVKIAPQLQQILPGHGFRLLAVQSKRLIAGQSLSCNLGQGLVAATELIQPIDLNGKVQLRCALRLNGQSQLDTLVSTPLNQLFFCDKMFDDGSRLLIGIGAR